MRLRTWIEPADTKAAQLLARRMWPRGPLHPGGLGWESATDQLPDPRTVADDGGNGIAGWAGLADGELVLQADPDVPEAARLLIQWATDTAGAMDLRVAVYDGDNAVREAVTQAGFTPDPGASAVTGMFMAARAVRPALPGGYRVRSVTKDELDARVAVHRAAWRPADLPWPGEMPPGVTANSESRMTAALHARVRATWLYDPDLDLVVEAPDGTLAGSCIVWWDPALKCAEIEPLGVVPRHRRKGLAGAMCLEAVSRVAALGGTQVFINVGPRPEYPAPAAAYLAAGFEVVTRGRIYHRIPSEARPGAG